MLSFNFLFKFSFLFICFRTFLISSFISIAFLSLFHILLYMWTIPFVCVSFPLFYTDALFISSARNRVIYICYIHTLLSHTPAETLFTHSRYHWAHWIYPCHHTHCCRIGGHILCESNYSHPPFTADKTAHFENTYLILNMNINSTRQPKIIHLSSPQLHFVSLLLTYCLSLKTLHIELTYSFLTAITVLVHSNQLQSHSLISRCLR